MSGYLFRGPYVKIPKTAIEELNNRDLARLVRRLVEEDKARRMRSRSRTHIPLAIWQPILEAFGFRCAYCGKSGIPLQKDHRVPKSKGGSDHPSNLVPACGPCNIRKYNHDPADWPLLVTP